MPLLIVVLGVLLLLILILVFKLISFLSLIIAALVVCIAEGMPISEVIISIQNGVGDALDVLALILGFGAMLGKFVADSGAAQRISTSLIASFGKKNIQWAVVLTGFVVGIPMFYSVGSVILVPLVFTIGVATGLPLIYIGLPMLASLSVTHGYLPPHPGPTAIAGFYNADMGLTLIYGIIVAIPAIIVAGPLFSRTLTRIKPNPPEKLYNTRILEAQEMPGFWTSVLTGLLPVFLIALAAAMTFVLPENSTLLTILLLIGDPVIALLLSVIVAIFTLGIDRNKNMKEIGFTHEESIGGIAMILLIIGAAGGFKQVLVDGGVGEFVSEIVQVSFISPLVLVWGIAALIRVSLGSATVAGLYSRNSHSYNSR